MGLKIDKLCNCPTITNSELCCNSVVEPEICLLPPALEDSISISIQVADNATIETQCPGILCVCGILEKEIEYTGVLVDGTETDVTMTLDVPFQCCIENCIINETEPEYEVASAEPICGCYKLLAKGTRDSKDVYFCLKEKDIIRVRVRTTE